MASNEPGNELLSKHDVGVRLFLMAMLPISLFILVVIFWMAYMVFLV